MHNFRFSKDVYWIFVRLTRADSAFLYTILEASEGIVSYSTLLHKEGELTRDLELQVPPPFMAEIQSLLAELSSWVTILPSDYDPSDRRALL
jgi:hypothetical protein